MRQSHTPPTLKQSVNLKKDVCVCVCLVLIVIECVSIYIMILYFLYIRLEIMSSFRMNLNQGPLLQQDHTIFFFSPAAYIIAVTSSQLFYWTKFSKQMISLKFMHVIWSTESLSSGEELEKDKREFRLRNGTRQPRFDVVSLF